VALFYHYLHRSVVICIICIIVFVYDLNIVEVCVIADVTFGFEDLWTSYGHDD